MQFGKSSLIILFLFATGIQTMVGEPGNRLDRSKESLTPALRQTAMPELGKGRLARILNRHYEDGLGGRENWAEISSLKASGTLKLESGEFILTALQKKPNLVKMTLRRNQQNVVMAFDGTNAWHRPPERGAKPVLMNEEEARRFIHSARFRSYLLHPFADGKELLYIDTVPVEGNICHQIRATLETGYQLDYFIDIRSFLEVKVENTDLLTGSTNSVLYSDYIREGGLPIARKVEGYEDGKWVSTLTLDEARVNAGVIPWMFEMPQ
ncbi:MAG: hypothetical protein GVY36_08310 [Verrucomicrobia bacterium]|jgi:hypothetical protein|nr:hypothetical protein [Verrucomicrobiota bacterium]